MRSLSGSVPGLVEKEALLVFNEFLAKMNQNEKLIGLGAIIALIGWVLGLFIASSSAVLTSINWYGTSGAQGTGALAVILAIVAIALVYLKYASTNIAWPLPLPLILLVVAAIGAILALIGLLQAFSQADASFVGISKPITLYLVVLIVLVGCALQTYASYLEWDAAGRPTGAAK